MGDACSSGCWPCATTWPAGGGNDPARQAVRRQLSAGVFPHRPGELRGQPGPRRPQAQRPAFGEGVGAWAGGLIVAWGSGCCWSCCSCRSAPGQDPQLSRRGGPGPAGGPSQALADCSFSPGSASRSACPRRCLPASRTAWRRWCWRPIASQPPCSGSRSGGRGISGRIERGGAGAVLGLLEEPGARRRLSVADLRRHRPVHDRFPGRATVLHAPLRRREQPAMSDDPPEASLLACLDR